MKVEQLKQLRDLNVELLETLILTLSSIKEYSEKHGIPLPTEDKFAHLIRKAINLIDEINEAIALPPNLQHLFRDTSRRLHRTKIRKVYQRRLKQLITKAV